MEAFIWIAIAVCISQSAMFSGLNLAFFSLTKLRLELEMSKGNPLAPPVARLREDSNFLLATILWGNVGVNVLLTLLSGSVLAGAAAFLFSTFVITIVGEIIPQAYLSRNALKAAALLAPVIRFYQLLLFPLAKPTAWALNNWLGKEGIEYVRDEDLTALILLQRGKAAETGVDDLQSQGLINVMRLKDTPLSAVGSVVDPGSVVRLDARDGRWSLPERGSDDYARLLARIESVPHSRIVLTDARDTPRLVLDARAFLAKLQRGDAAPLAECCYEPLVYATGERTVDDLLEALHERLHRAALVWTEDAKRIISSRDVLAVLVEGIVDDRA